MAWGGGTGPLNFRRSATLSSCAIWATEPMRMLFDSPVREMSSCCTPHSGPIRGNRTNSRAMIGNPNSAVRAASVEAWRRLGWPTGICASTKAVKRPQTDTSIAAATSIDCEYKKCVNTRKKPRKKTTNASRRARSSIVFNATSTTARVTPGSLPMRVP